MHHVWLVSIFDVCFSAASDFFCFCWPASHLTVEIGQRATGRYVLRGRGNLSGSDAGRVMTMVLCMVMSKDAEKKALTVDVTSETKKNSFHASSSHCLNLLTRTKPPPLPQPF